MNWGKGIALVYSLFVLAMVGAVFASRKHDPGLVSKNYYDLDLTYEARMEAKRNYAALADKCEIQYQSQGQTIACRFPMEAGMPGDGAIRLLYSNELGHDVAIPIQPDANGGMTLSASNLPKGSWRVEAEWKAGGKPYFYETSLLIP
ncbi:MAG: FixH family protein [Saprospiraceae bacterium]|nr:FixH family protein [Saprospiraceae bacterium]